MSRIETVDRLAVQQAATLLVLAQADVAALLLADTPAEVRLAHGDAVAKMRTALARLDAAAAEVR